MVESCIVIVFLCLLFLGLFQLVHAYVAREVLIHAAARGARAKTVGFNHWMVEKTVRVAAIPNAGALVEPAIPGGDPALTLALATLGPGDLWDFALSSAPKAASLGVELARIPNYLASDNPAQASAILDYADWPTITPDPMGLSGLALSDPSAPGAITARVRQGHHLLVATDALADADVMDPESWMNQTNEVIRLIGRFDIEAHYPFYIDDQMW
jgi:hypothetical protein